MWEHRCQVAVSGVGFSRVTRSAEIPLASHALEAVKGAVEDSGLALADIDGLATYPELPATGHAMVDGITVVSVNCMMAMLKLPNLSWHVQVETVNIGGAVQQAVNALLAGVCTVRGGLASDAQPPRHLSELARHLRPGRVASSPLPTGSVVQDREWPSPTRAGWSGTTRTGRRWRPSR